MVRFIIVLLIFFSLNFCEDENITYKKGDKTIMKRKCTNNTKLTGCFTADNVKDESCDCFIGNDDGEVKFCHWGHEELLAFSSGEAVFKCELLLEKCEPGHEPDQSTTLSPNIFSLQLGRPMECMPDGVYPPIRSRDPSSTLNSAVYCNESVNFAYIHVVTCLFVECLDRYRIPDGYHSCIPRADQQPYWLGFGYEPFSFCSIGGLDAYEDATTKHCVLKPQCIYGLNTKWLDPKRYVLAPNIEITTSEISENMILIPPYNDCDRLCVLSENAARSDCQEVPACSDHPDLLPEEQPDNPFSIYDTCYEWCPVDAPVDQFDCVRRPFCTFSLKAGTDRNPEKEFIYVVPPMNSSRNMYNSDSCLVRPCDKEGQAKCWTKTNPTSSNKFVSIESYRSAYDIMEWFPMIHAVGVVLVLFGIFIKRDENIHFGNTTFIEVQTEYYPNTENKMEKVNARERRIKRLKRAAHRISEGVSKGPMDDIRGTSSTSKTAMSSKSLYLKSRSKRSLNPTTPTEKRRSKNKSSKKKYRKKPIFV